MSGAEIEGDIECVLTTWGTDRPALQKIRREVFIEEQAVPESDEWDSEDPVSVHALATLNREPVGTGRLNPGGKIGRIAVIAGLRDRGIGILITDHNVRETLAITDRAYILYDGKILVSGTASEIASNPVAREIYLGEKFAL